MNFDRNFIRHQILPLIASRWSHITENLARAASHCATADRFIENHIKLFLDESLLDSDKSLSISTLLTFPLEIQNLLLRTWLQSVDLPLPSTKKLYLLQRELIESRQDAKPLLCWKGVEVRRYNQRLYATPPLVAHDAGLKIAWNLKEDLLLPHHLGKIMLMDITALGIQIEDLSDTTIRFRQGGERCKIKNKKHSQSLKKLLQAWRVPPWQRDRIPLLYEKEHIKAIIGYAACE
jgi:tRNA(Ile)-lysidine synthase